MLLPKTMCLLLGLATFFLSAMLLHAQPVDAVSSVTQEGIMVTSLAQPQFFVFRYGNREEHFDGTEEAMLAQGGFDSGEPITGLHYLRPRVAVDGSPWNDEDRKLLDAEFHGAATGSYYLFKTVEGQLFYLPKEGEARVVRVDYRLRNGRKVTVWVRK
jgi:hypothetical protein